jgi:hypothetical protein
MRVPKCLKNCQYWNKLLDRCVRCSNCDGDKCYVCNNRIEEASYAGDLVCPEFLIGV